MPGYARISNHDYGCVDLVTEWLILAHTIINNVTRNQYGVLQPQVTPAYVATGCEGYC
jgi:hypothetical protein